MSSRDESRICLTPSRSLLLLFWPPSLTNSNTYKKWAEHSSSFSQVQFQVKMVSFVRSFLFASTFLSLVLFIESRETAKRQVEARYLRNIFGFKRLLNTHQEIDDALQYLTQMDRYYSEHVRPRFGKRGDAGGEGEEVKRSAAFLRSRPQAMVDNVTAAATKAAFSYCWLLDYVKKAVVAASEHCQTSLTGLAEVPDAGGPCPQGLRPLHGGGQQESQDSSHLANKDWYRLLFWKKASFSKYFFLIKYFNTENNGSHSPQDLIWGKYFLELSTTIK